MSVRFNPEKNLPVNEDAMSGSKSGVTEICKYVNKLTHINTTALTQATNKLTSSTNKVTSEKEIKSAIDSFHSDVKEILDNVTETISSLKKIKS